MNKSNNYITKVYFPPPQFNMIKSIDKISINNIHPKNTQNIFNFLEDNGFKMAALFKLKKGIYKKKRTYEIEKSPFPVDIFYDIKELQWYNFLKLTIHDPDKQILTMFDSFFRDHYISPKVTEVELTFDLFTEDAVGLREWFNQHLFMKYNRMDFDSGYITTFYLGNIRETKSKGIRVYLKPKKGQKKYVRFELVLKRNVIRSLGLENTLSNIDSLDLNRFFDFKMLDENKIINHVLWKNRNQIARLEKRRKGSGSLLERQIMENFIYGSFRQEELKEKIKMLKGDVSQCNRFLLSLDDFNAEFLKMASAQNFLGNG